MREWRAPQHREGPGDATFTGASCFGADEGMVRGKADFAWGALDGGRGLVVENGEATSILFGGKDRLHGTFYSWTTLMEQEQEREKERTVRRSSTAPLSTPPPTTEHTSPSSPPPSASSPSKPPSPSFPAGSSSPSPSSTPSSISHSSASPFSISRSSPSPPSQDSLGPSLARHAEADEQVECTAMLCLGLPFAPTKSLPPIGTAPVGTRRLGNGQAAWGICTFWKERSSRLQENKGGTLRDTRVRGTGGGGRYSMPGYLDKTVPTDGAVEPRRPPPSSSSLLNTSFASSSGSHPAAASSLASPFVDAPRSSFKLTPSAMEQTALSSSSPSSSSPQLFLRDGGKAFENPAPMATGSLQVSTRAKKQQKRSVLAEAAAVPSLEGLSLAEDVPESGESGVGASRTASFAMLNRRTTRAMTGSLSARSSASKEWRKQEEMGRDLADAKDEAIWGNELNEGARGRRRGGA